MYRQLGEQPGGVAWLGNALKTSIILRLKPRLRCPDSQPPRPHRGWDFTLFTCRRLPEDRDEGIKTSMRFPDACKAKGITPTQARHAPGRGWFQPQPPFPQPTRFLSACSPGPGRRLPRQHGGGTATRLEPRAPPQPAALRGHIPDGRPSPAEGPRPL